MHNDTPQDREDQLRHDALMFANANRQDEPAGEVVRRANKYLEFLKEGSSSAESLLGQTVLYRLTEGDVQEINRRRDDGRSPRSAAKHESGAQVHVGNQVCAGEVVPMVVVNAWSPDCVNGQVLLDGNDSLWVTSAECGNHQGQWVPR